jgi:hypothetical protein
MPMISWGQSVAWPVKVARASKTGGTLRDYPEYEDIPDDGRFSDLFSALSNFWDFAARAGILAGILLCIYIVTKGAHHV